MEILGTFKDMDSAARAVEGLLGAGFAEAQIDSLTSIPYPDGVLVKRQRHTWFRWLALFGWVAGAAAGFGLAAGTAWLYPVQTGDKPIIALYPAAIVTFEVAMLFAIVGTMAGMFMEMGLPSMRNRPYDSAIADGCIGICLAIHSAGEMVSCGSVMPNECIGEIAILSVAEQRERATAVMRQAGALRVIAEETL